jgi:hypothetical protein
MDTSGINYPPLSLRTGFAPPHPALRATFSPLGRRGSKTLVRSEKECAILSAGVPLRPCGEKVPEGRMRGYEANS